MGRVTRASDRHIIWSNRSLDVDDWREDYKEFLEANELDDDPNDEQALYEWMVETNDDYLSDERMNLNVQLSQPIIVIGDIGRWNGRVMGYKDIPSGNIKDCLYADTDYTEWYVDMSRLGRNYLQVGFYTEILFPQKDVRFLAINNSIDSNNASDNDFAPFLNIMNEFYAKDTSNKIKAVFDARMKDGKRCSGSIPYG